MNIRDLTMLGAALYACEGTKARRDYRSKNRYIYSIELTNSNPLIVKCFSMFLEKVIKADWSRVKGQMFLYPDLDEKKLKAVWSQASAIPTTQFQKTIYLKQKTGKFKANPLGTFKLRYSCKEDYLRLEKMIEKLWRDARAVEWATLER